MKENIQNLLIVISLDGNGNLEKVEQLKKEYKSKYGVYYNLNNFKKDGAYGFREN